MILSIFTLNHLNIKISDKGPTAAENAPIFIKYMKLFIVLVSFCFINRTLNIEITFNTYFVKILV
jgi:hypothetical protein